MTSEKKKSWVPAFVDKPIEFRYYSVYCIGFAGRPSSMNSKDRRIGGNVTEVAQGFEERL